MGKVAISIFIVNSLWVFYRFNFSFLISFSKFTGSVESYSGSKGSEYKIPISIPVSIKFNVIGGKVFFLESLGASKLLKLFYLYKEIPLFKLGAPSGINKVSLWLEWCVCET